MPCRSDYMEPTARERENKRVAGFLHEVGLRPEYKQVGQYGVQEGLDSLTALLCTWCKANDVTTKSLELQIWWRDHKKIDEARERREQKLSGNVTVNVDNLYQTYRQMLKE